MARCVGIFGAEGGAEGVNVGIGKGKAFGFELAGNGQACRFAEKVFGIVDIALVVERRVLHIERGDMEHFARAFAVARGYERGVDINKALIRKKAVNALRGDRTHAENGVEGICAGAQMRNGTQEFEGMPFGLDRVFGRGLPRDLDAFRL